MSDDKNEKTIEKLKAEVDRLSHPAARIFPLLIDKRDNDGKANEWEALLEDMQKNGLSNEDFGR